MFYFKRGPPRFSCVLAGWGVAASEASRNSCVSRVVHPDSLGFVGRACRCKREVGGPREVEEGRREVHVDSLGVLGRECTCKRS
jgi:hypothetical protein